MLDFTFILTRLFSLDKILFSIFFSNSCYSRNWTPKLNIMFFSWRLPILWRWPFVSLSVKFCFSECDVLFPYAFTRFFFKCHFLHFPSYFKRPRRVIIYSHHQFLCLLFTYQVWNRSLTYTVIKLEPFKLVSIKPSINIEEKTFVFWYLYIKTACCPFLSLQVFGFPLVKESVK